MIEFVVDTLRRPNFLAFVALFLCGLFIAITNHNLVKKVIGLYLVQTSVLFVLVTFSAKQGATVPIVVAGETRVDARAYVNPLPHALTLTGIVVGVATLGVSLSVVAAIYRRYDSLDEDEILNRLG
jgi:multicomponent Na+:H+ antiporter subunit C